MGDRQKCRSFFVRNCVKKKNNAVKVVVMSTLLCYNVQEIQQLLTKELLWKR